MQQQPQERAVVKLNGKYAVLTHGTHTRQSSVRYDADIHAATLFHAFNTTHVRGVKGDVVKVLVTIVEVV